MKERVLPTVSGGKYLSCDSLAQWGGEALVILFLSAPFHPFISLTMGVVGHWRDRSRKNHHFLQVSNEGSGSECAPNRQVHT